MLGRNKFPHVSNMFMRCYCGSVRKLNISEEKLKERGKRIKHTVKLNKYFESAPHLVEMKQYLPDKYLLQKRAGSIENLYLVDIVMAKKIVKHMMPHINDKPQIVCETAPGLGLITSELLENDVKLVRLYESCPEFRNSLKDFNKLYPGRVELFVKDIFQLPKMSYYDKMDKNSRVEQMLKHVPKKAWTDGPAMTIVGVMPKIHFITYLIKTLAQQTEIISHGRLQMFAVMRPSDYITLSAGPELNLHTYQSWSVLFNLFFEHSVLEKFDRKAFLPWETKSEISGHTRYKKRIDVDRLYLVRINLKKKLPLAQHHLMPFLYFVRQCFGRGTNKVIGTLEKWIPGIGIYFILPSLPHQKYFKRMSIFTKFGELQPEEILALFEEMVNHPDYTGSSFAAMVEAELLKSETRETTLEDDVPFNQDLIDDLEEKLND